MYFKNKKPPQVNPIRPSITNTIYEPINVKKNKIMVDEVEDKIIENRLVNNQTYQTLGNSSEEEVEGFGETDSIDYIQVNDNKSENLRRRSSNNSIDLNDNLKNNKNYQNTAKRKMSLLDELKEKIPEMVPKNMMEE